MAESRRRSDAPQLFQGKEVSYDFLPELWRKGTEQRQFSRYRINTARGIRTKTQVVQLRQSWKQRHPEASEWVVKVLPERRTLERDLIAAVGSVEPTYSRTAIGFLDRDRAGAESCESYMNTWREEYVPTQTFFEKGAEDGEYGVVILPTDQDRDGLPDLYERLSERAYNALPDEDERRETYRPYEVTDPKTGEKQRDPKRRYAFLDDDGSPRKDPAYDRDRSGKRRGDDDQDFERDDDKSKEAYDEAVCRYLLKQEQGAATVRVIPANDCVPLLVRGTKRDRWRLFALVERTLYYPEELLDKGYGWRGMGDHALIPQGFDATRTTGQQGMWYLYTLYRTWVDPNDPKKVERPIVCYSVGGNPTWNDGEPDEAGQKMPDNGVAVIDLYETHGLEGPFWWYGGGLHTSDDDPDFYWEPYLWPLAETIFGIEGISTMANASVAVQGSMGYFHKPDGSLLGDGKFSADDLLEDDGSLVVPELPDAGEIKTAAGDIFPATPAQTSPDLWRVIGLELESLRANTTLEQAGAGSQKSGHAMMVKETIAQVAKRHIREGALDAVKFCGERAMRIFEACEREFDVKWPLQTTKERPVGSEVREAGDVLVWDSTWVGEGEYRLQTDYPSEYNPVKVEVAMEAADRSYGSPEDVWDAMGITDHETQWAKILKWGIRRSPAYMEARATQVAKASGDKLMLKVLRLQQQQRMTQQGGPGFEAGLPSSALRGPGEGGGQGGPNAAERSLGGQVAAQTGPAMRDAQAQAQIPGAA